MYVGVWGWVGGICHFYDCVCGFQNCHKCQKKQTLSINLIKRCRGMCLKKCVQVYLFCIVGGLGWGVCRKNTPMCVCATVESEQADHEH